MKRNGWWRWERGDGQKLQRKERKKYTNTNTKIQIQAQTQIQIQIQNTDLGDEEGWLVGKGRQAKTRSETKGDWCDSGSNICLFCITMNSNWFLLSSRHFSGGAGLQPTFSIAPLIIRGGRIEISEARMKELVVEFGARVERAMLTNPAKRLVTGGFTGPLHCNICNITIPAGDNRQYWGFAGVCWTLQEHWSLLVNTAMLYCTKNAFATIEHCISLEASLSPSPI